MTARILGPLKTYVQREVNATVHGTGGMHLERYEAPLGDPGLLGPDSVTWRVHSDPPGMLSSYGDMDASPTMITL